MQIDAIGSYMYVSPVYSVNNSSVDFAQEISSDVSFGVSAVENRLKPGESKNFADILASQLSMSQYNQDRLFDVGQEEIDLLVDDIADEMQKFQSMDYNDEQVEDATETYMKVEASEESSNQYENKQGEYSLYQMNRAIDAYNVSMGVL